MKYMYLVILRRSSGSLKVSEVYNRIVNIYLQFSVYVLGFFSCFFYLFFHWTWNLAGFFSHKYKVCFF